MYIKKQINKKHARPGKEPPEIRGKEYRRMEIMPIHTNHPKQLHNSLGAE